MRILFTENDSILSKLIRLVTEEPVSHCALECGGWVIHSNLLGVHVELSQTFCKNSTVLYSLDIDLDINKIMSALSRYEGSRYDLGAMLYLGLRCIFPFLPKKNLWQSSGMFLCTEWITEVLDGNEDSLITPYKLYVKLKEKQV